MIRFAWLLGLALVLPACASKEVVVQKAPPENRPETRDMKPGPDYFWRPGHWVYSSSISDYTWEPGRWIHERQNMVFSPGYWEKKPEGWVWHEDSWEERGR